MLDQLNLTGRPKTPFIAQAEASECGLACLAMICGFHGSRTDIFAIRQRNPVSARGMTLTHLLDIAEQLGFSARPLRGDIDDLPNLTLPAILHWDMSHFVVLDQIRDGPRGTRYVINDPARGRRILRQDELSRSFTGVAVDLIKVESFRPKAEQTQLRITQLWSAMVGFWASIGVVLSVSLVMHLALLAAPFLSQIAIDNVLPSADRDLLTVLGVGFFMLAVVSLAANWLRGLVIVSLNNALTYQVVVNLANHLLRLPITWFEKRHVGDVVSRFNSTQPIGQLLSQGMVAAFVDGLMSLITLTLMMIYSLKLTLIALAALGLYVLLRVAFLQALKLRNIDAITTAAHENSLFIETVRGIGAIKAFGQEGNRQRVWQRAKADAVNAQIKLGRLTAGFDSLGMFVPAAERVIFIVIAVGLALNGELTVGMVFAFQAYKQHFLDAGIRLTEQAVNYRILHVHLGRISDIALARTEIEPTDRRLRDIPDLSRGLSVRGVRYRYAPGDPEILSGAFLDIKAGEMIALTGPSGGGKTTLLRVMMGLLEPTGGGVFLGDEPLTALSKTGWRRSIGSVAQDDALFAGSLADNIAFFDTRLDMSRVEEAARAACIHDEIVAFPMGYDTLVGDMGSVLSGGQKQRVLLARALYARPKLLFLDEGTANLDAASEAKVLDALKALPIIRVVVAHRPQSIEAADRVYVVVKGRVSLMRDPAGKPSVPSSNVDAQPA